MSDNDSCGFGTVLFILLIVVGFGYIFTEMALEPGRVEKIDTMLIADSNLEFVRITVNSPAIYIEVSGYTEFLSLLKSNNCVGIYRQDNGSPYYYIFNEDFSIGWRIHWIDIWKDTQ